MERQIHFISGLPRAGSTLTAAILRQNPRFHAGMSSPVAGLFDAVLGQVSAGSELAHLVDSAARARLLRGLFASFYEGTSAEVIFDTNRTWAAHLPALVELFPTARFVCLVRNVAWIMDSLERQYRASTFDYTRLFGTPMERATVYTRVEALAGATRLVGMPWHALREACYSEHADRIVLIDYDLLSARPKEVFDILYDFLDEPPFNHDFSNVHYDAERFDLDLGIEGLHRVHSNVAPRPRGTILPPDLFDKYAALSFWTDIVDSKAFRITTSA